MRASSPPAPSSLLVVKFHPATTMPPRASKDKKNTLETKVKLSLFLIKHKHTYGVSIVYSNLQFFKVIQTDILRWLNCFLPQGAARPWASNRKRLPDKAAHCGSNFSEGMRSKCGIVFQLLTNASVPPLRVHGPDRKTSFAFTAITAAASRVGSKETVQGI